MPKLSVIMPVYNSEKFLKRSIESVLNQTFKDLELILVNDGSIDNSLSICKEYEKKDNRVIVIDKQNEGAGPTRNKGIEIATGEYLAFPDSDDWLDLDCYKICIERLEKNNSDLLVFGVKTHVYDDKKSLVTKVIEEKAGAIVYKTWQDCRRNWIDLRNSCDADAPWNKIYKHSIIREFNIRYPDMRRMQDGVFNMRYFDKISSVEVIEDCLFNRTWHSDEFQNKKMPKNLLECLIQYHETAISCIKKWGICESEARKHFDNMYIETVNTIIFTYKPKSDRFKEIYKYIKNVNNNEYTKKVFVEYKRNNKLTKKQTVCYKRWNLLLAVYLRFIRKAK